MDGLDKRWRREGVLNGIKRKAKTRKKGKDRIRTYCENNHNVIAPKRKPRRLGGLEGSVRDHDEWEKDGIPYPERHKKP